MDDSFDMDVELLDLNTQPCASKDSFSEDMVTVDNDAVLVKNVEEFEHLSEKMRQIDQLAHQLMIGLELRKGLEKCRSERSEPLLEVYAEVRILSTGSQLLILSLKNRTNHVLNDWVLTIFAHSLHSQKNIGYSRNEPIGVLAVGQSITVELLIKGEEIELPALLRLQIHRVFLLDSISQCFRIELDSVHVSLLNLLKPCPSKDQLHQPSSRTFSLNFACSLVNLVSGSPDADDTALVLKFVLKRSGLDEGIGNGSSTLDVLLPFEGKTHIVSLAVTKQAGLYSLTVGVRDSVIRQRLQTDIETMTVVECQRLKKRPNDDSLGIVSDQSSISNLFKSLVSEFFTSG